MLFWGAGQAEYLAGVFGGWAWNPPHHDWDATRMAIYRRVFGKLSAPRAAQFDAKLVQLAGLFVQFGPNSALGRLRNVTDREPALKLVAELETLLEALDRSSPTETRLSVSRLRTSFLQPMRRSVEFAKAAAALDFPEYAYPDLDARLRKLAVVGEHEQMERELAPVREPITRQLRAIEAALPKPLPGLEDLTGYIRTWEQRLTGQAYARLRPTSQPTIRPIVIQQ